MPPEIVHFKFPYIPRYYYTEEDINRAADAPPIRDLGVIHLPTSHVIRRPPLLHFGWSFIDEGFVKWGKKNGILTDPDPGSERGPFADHEDVSVLLQHESLKTLFEKAGMPPHFRPRFKISLCAKQPYLITISSNYRFLKDRKVIGTREIDKLDRYLKDQGIVGDSPAWYLDHEDFRWRRAY